jgi:hypothetical protein
MGGLLVVWTKINNPIKSYTYNLFQLKYKVTDLFIISISWTDGHFSEKSANLNKRLAKAHAHPLIILRFLISIRE